jgi:hypothetical protein
MLAAAERVARFLETRDPVLPGQAFAAVGVVIIENFAPFVFEGPDAVALWTREMLAHLTHLTDLRHTFGPPQDFSADADTAYFSLPTTWRGATRGRPFTETGGWSFVLAGEAGDWRVRAYGWSVTGYSA